MRFDHDVTTTCGYCVVGWRLEAHAVDGRVVSISPTPDGPANKGHTCLEGRFAHGFSRKRGRLRTPLIRDERGGELRPATWDEAIARIVSELTRIATAPAAPTRSPASPPRARRTRTGHVFTAFHLPEIRTNRLIGPSADVNTSCPEYNVVAVDVRPVAEQASRTPAIASAS